MIYVVSKYSVTKDREPTELPEIKNVEITEITGLSNITTNSEFIDSITFEGNQLIYKKATVELNDNVKFKVVIPEDSKERYGIITNKTLFTFHKDFNNFNITNEVIDINSRAIEIQVSHKNGIKMRTNKMNKIVTTYMTNKKFKINQTFMHEGFKIYILDVSIDDKKSAYIAENPSVYLTSTNIVLYDGKITLTRNHKIEFEVLSSVIKIITYSETIRAIASKIILDENKLYSLNEEYTLVYLTNCGTYNKIKYRIKCVSLEEKKICDNKINKNSVIKNKLSQEDLYKILLLTIVNTNTLSTVVETKKYLIKSITLRVAKRKGFGFGSIFDDSPKAETLNKSDITKFLKDKDEHILSVKSKIIYDPYELEVIDYSLFDRDMSEADKLRNFVFKINDDAEIIFEKSDVKIVETTTDNGFTLNIETIKKLPEMLREMGMGGIESYITKIIREVLITRTNLLPKAISALIKPSKGIIMHGPPGTGKTTLAKNMASILGCDEAHINKITATEILSMWHGKSEENARELFRPAIEEYKKHGENSKLYFLIIDEIDAIIGKRENHAISQIRSSIVNQLLGLMDGLVRCDNIIVVGITNRLDSIDKAMLRPGRFGCHIEVGLPNTAQRREIIKIYYDKIHSAKVIADIDIDHFAIVTDGFSCADIENLFSICLAKYYEKMMMKSEVDESDIISSDELMLLVHDHISESPYDPEITRSTVARALESIMHKI